MSVKLINKLIRQSKEKKPSIGEVYWIDGNRADIKIPGSATVYQNCVVEGDASIIERGQAVVLIWDKHRPTVVSPSTQDYLTSSDLDEILDQLDLENKTAAIDWKILSFRSGSMYQSFSSDAVGLISALGSVGTDGLVLLPEVTIEGDFTVGTGVHLMGMRNSIIQGTINIKGGSLSNLEVQKYSYATNSEAAVTIENGEEVEIRDCKFIIYQSNTAPVYAVWAKGTRPVRIFDSYLLGQHDTGGSAYGIYMDECDDVFVYGGYLGGTTAPYLGA